MKFRVTDERDWVAEFDAATPGDLVTGVRSGWDEFIRMQGGEVHPGLALRVRLAEIDRWLAGRMARLDATAEQHRSWTANADHQRYVANRNLGGEEGLSPLRLHVLGDAEPATWLVPVVHGPYAPQVARLLEPERARELLAQAQRMVDHHRNLMALGSDLEQALRREQHPVPCLVPQGSRPMKS